MTDLAHQLAKRARDEIARWVYLSAPHSKRLGNSLARFFAGPVFEAGAREMTREWRKPLTMAERQMRAEAAHDGRLPRLATAAAEIRLLLELHAPGYRKPLCRFCGPVTHATRCAWPECPLVDPRARDIIHIEGSKEAVAWPPKEPDGVL